MSEHDPIADGSDWYAGTDLSEHIASGKVARVPRPRDGQPMSTFALRISDGVLDDVADVARRLLSKASSKLGRCSIAA